MQCSTQYTHRLPADYDMGASGARRTQSLLGPLSLDFQGFRQEMGRSRANAYSSLYLWRDAEALRRWSRGEVSGGD
jgi:hypothetical protein